MGLQSPEFRSLVEAERQARITREQNRVAKLGPSDYEIRRDRVRSTALDLAQLLWGRRGADVDIYIAHQGLFRTQKEYWTSALKIEEVRHAGIGGWIGERNSASAAPWIEVTCLMTDGSVFHCSRFGSKYGDKELVTQVPFNVTDALYSSKSIQNFDAQKSLDRLERQLASFVVDNGL